MKQTKRSLQQARGYQDRQGERNGYRQILVRLSNEDFEHMALLAQDEGVSFATMMRWAVRDWIERP